jgi:hypothetical protein
VIVAAQLGIADVVAAKGPLSSELISAELGTKPHLLRRFLRAIASIGVFAEDEQGRFGMTPLSELLRSDHPMGARAAVLLTGDELQVTAWGGLLEALRTGEVPFTKLYNASFFDYLRHHPEREKAFAAAMSSNSIPQNLAIAEAYPFSEIETLVDVGGSNGHLLSAILRRHPRLNGILFELPSTAEAARKAGYVSAPDIRDRVRVEGGDALVGVPPGADAYLFKWIMHNWDDDNAVSMLRNCRKAMAPYGKVLIAEAIIKPGNDEDPTKFVDLNMFLMFGGQERTEEQYRLLYERANLRLNRIIATAAPFITPISILEAVAA